MQRRGFLRHLGHGAAALPCLTPLRARAAVLREDALQGAAAAIEQAVRERRLPGAVLWIEKLGSPPHRAVFGQRAWEPEPEALREDAVFDVASLTKPVVTATLAAQALSLGLIALDEPVAQRTPGLLADDTITWRHLLTHSAALPASLPLATAWQGRAAALALAAQQRPTHAPGSFFRYSDVNYIVLGAALERLLGQNLAQRAEERLLAPLGMHDSGYLPQQRHASARLVPTEWEGARLLRGEVHDPTARRMGGVAGHAGLFSTASDLARYARAVLQGELPGVSRAVRAQMTANAAPPGLPGAVQRGLGWDIDSPFSRPRGALFTRGGSFGHTGFTGCAMWLEPALPGFYLLMSNRVHPRGNASIVALYEQVGTWAARAMGL